MSVPLVLHKGAGLERKGEEGLVVWKQRLFRISMWPKFRFQNQNLLRIQPLSWTAGDHMMVCSGLWRPQAQLFHIFSTTTNLVIHSKRENLQWSRMTKGAIRRQERGKSLRCNFAVLPHTTPLGFKSLKSLLARDQKWNSFHAFWNFTLWCVSFPLGL